MKKYLLTALLGLFGFIGTFTSALDVNSSTTTVNFVKIDDYGSYSPDTLYIQKNFVLSVDDISNYSCDDYSVVAFTLCESEEDCTDADPDICYFNYDSENGWVPSEGYDCNFSEGDIIWVNRDDGYACDSITIDFSTSVGESGGSGFPIFTGTATTYLSGGTLALKPALDGLKGTMMEFIPYIAYIGLGIIIAVLGFVAIRWLVNRVRAKIFDSF